MSRARVRIEAIALRAAGLEALRHEAAAEDHAFLDRLQTEWDSGANRFDRPGERLVGAFLGDSLIGIGGLNLDPYAGNPRIGRLRHLYVAADWRRQDVATAIVRHLLAGARGRFDLVRLRTDNAAAAAFYVALGFEPVESDRATHRIALR